MSVMMHLVYQSFRVRWKCGECRGPLFESPRIVRMIALLTKKSRGQKDFNFSWNSFETELDGFNVTVDQVILS